MDDPDSVAAPKSRGVDGGANPVNEAGGVVEYERYVFRASIVSIGQGRGRLSVLDINQSTDYYSY